MFIFMSLVLCSLGMCRFLTYRNYKGIYLENTIYKRIYLQTLVAEGAYYTAEWKSVDDVKMLTNVWTPSLLLHVQFLVTYQQYAV